ncbi:MAG: transglycosylase SLT domain-containing protein [Bacteroidota bacterium]
MPIKLTPRYLLLLKLSVWTILHGQEPYIDDQVQLVRHETDSLHYYVVQDCDIYAEGWDTLPQTRFWRLVMQLSPDTSLINISTTRQILGGVSTYWWDSKSSRRKERYKDSIHRKYKLPKKAEAYITSGKSHFYKHHHVFPVLGPAIDAFTEEGVDPWFAQAILLIESPGQLQRSTAGAYGSFQLMKKVAKEQGLVINDTLDEREDPIKSARGAARLIRSVCLPNTRKILAKYDLTYQETDIWFRLMVMHVYHAGTRNVKGLLRRIKPTEGGIPLIKKVWSTTYRRFGNASQNYSQVALASMLELDRILFWNYEIQCR